ncbi:MAG: SpoIID/LytB domain-containing protein [Acidaminococcaceae bacterium]|nr:SpoIID/LytB domain-containing protein [Acidaminococcaceae bacterium]
MKKILLSLLICLLPWRAAAENIRVSLARDQQSVPLEAYADFEMVNLDDGSSRIVEAGTYYLNERSGEIYLSDLRGGSRIQINRKDGGSVPSLGHKRYNGKLVAFAKRGRVQVNNEVDLEFLVTSALPGKSSPIWPDEAIKAQAVAARSYAKYMKLLNREKDFDIEATDQELSFNGLGEEKSIITKMVQATRGQYLQDRDGMPAMAITTSSSGGRTESAVNVFGVSYSYLQSVEDYDSDSPDFNWTYDASPDMVQNFLEQTGEVYLGKLTSITLSPINEPGKDRTPSGRVQSMQIRGSEGVARVPISMLMTQLELKSSLFDVETGIPLPDKLDAPIYNYYGVEVGRKDIDINWGNNRPKTWQGIRKGTHTLTGNKEERITFRGRGKGHGMGLSIWGARGMANKNFKYDAILAHYYKNTKLIK